MSTLVGRTFAAAAALLLVAVPSAFGATQLFEAVTPDGGLRIGYGPGWREVPDDERSFYLVRTSGETLRVEQVIGGEESLEELAAGFEKDLRSVGAAVERKPFESAAARGFQIEGEIERREQKYHLLQTIVGGDGSAYLLTIALPPEEFEAIEAELREMLASIAVGEELEGEQPEEIEPTDAPLVPELPPTPTEAEPAEAPEILPPEERREEPKQPEPPPEKEAVPKKPGYLGAQIATMTPDLAKSLGIKHIPGAAIVDVLAGAPAQKAGLKTGDIITAVDGKPVSEAEQVSALVALAGAGDKVRIDLSRRGEKLWVAVVLGEFPEQQREVPAETRERPRGWLGVQIATLTPELAEKSGVRDVDGVLVMDVVSGGPAEKWGLKPRDIILGVNEKKIRTAEELQGFLAETEPDERLKLSVLRDAERITVTVVTGRYPEPSR